MGKGVWCRSMVRVGKRVWGRGVWCRSIVRVRKECGVGAW